MLGIVATLPARRVLPPVSSCQWRDRPGVEVEVGVEVGVEVEVEVART
jgi:hypothetical protein